jgi:cytochrome b561
MVCLIASFVVAMTLFHRKNAGSIHHQVYTSHFSMGIALPAAAVLPAILAAVRPALTSKYRLPWRVMHSVLGYGIIGLGKPLTWCCHSV